MGDIQTGELVTEHQTGVYSYLEGAIIDNIVKRGMSENDCLGKWVGFVEKFSPNPEQLLRILLIQRKRWINPGMNQKSITAADAEFELLKKREVSSWYR
jgi:hypothetical protein